MKHCEVETHTYVYTCVTRGVCVSLCVCKACTEHVSVLTGSSIWTRAVSESWGGSPSPSTAVLKHPRSGVGQSHTSGARSGLPFVEVLSFLHFIYKFPIG